MPMPKEIAPARQRKEPVQTGRIGATFNAETIKLRVEAACGYLAPSVPKGQ